MFYAILLIMFKQEMYLVSLYLIFSLSTLNAISISCVCTVNHIWLSVNEI